MSGMALELQRLGLLLFLFISMIFIWMPHSKADCYCLEISFLNVGQGDAIYIKTPDGHDAIIDAGVDTSILRELSGAMSFFDAEIDLVVATHPDLDHIGGLPDVFERFSVLAFLETTNINETPAAAALAAAAENENTQHIYADAGQVIRLGQEVYLQVLAPNGDETHWESNSASIVLRVVYGDTAILLTGDLPAEIENHLVDLYGEQLESDILKLGHHGSKTSTSEAWLNAVQPRFAVVSAGVGNRYGHPHQEVMQRVFSHNIETSHTGTDGTVAFYSDGKQVWRE